MEFWPGPQKINLKCGNKSRQIMHCLYGFWPEPQKMNLSVGILYWNYTVYVHHTQQNLHLIFSFSLGESMYVYIHSSCEPKIFGMGQYNLCYKSVLSLSKWTPYGLYVPGPVSLPLPTASLELLFMMLSRTIWDSAWISTLSLNLINLTGFSSLGKGRC